MSMHLFLDLNRHGPGRRNSLAPTFEEEDNITETSDPATTLPSKHP